MQPGVNASDWRSLAAEIYAGAMHDQYYARFPLDALHRAIEEQRLARELSLAQVARESAVSATTIKRLSREGAVDGDSVLHMLHWLNRTIESFLVETGENERATADGAAVVTARRIDTSKLYTALDTLRIARGLTWHRLADTVGGVAPSSLTRLRRGGRMEFTLFLRLVDWLQQPPECFFRVDV